MENSERQRGAIRGRVLVVVAAVMWSTSGFFAKAPIFDLWPADQRVVVMVFWRALFASLVLLFLVRKTSWSWKMIPMTACFAAMNWAFMNALVYAESTTAIWLQYTAPAFVFVIGVLWFKEAIHRRDVWFLLFAVLGVGVILSFEIGRSSTRGIIYGVLSGALFAGVILSLRHMRSHDAAWLVFLNHAITALVFLPMYLDTAVQPAGAQWFYLAGFGMFQMGLPYMIVAQGLRNIPGHEASLILLLEPILVPVWVFLVWRNAASYDAPSTATIAGATLILIGLLFRYAAPWLTDIRKSAQPPS